MVQTLLFLIGLAVGSFLNVVIFRYFPEDSFFCNIQKCNGRSKCMTCDRQLKWYELIPIVSFFAQFGHCRGCHSKISWQYPLVELAGGLTFLLPFYFRSLPGLSSLFIANQLYFWIFSAIWISIFLVFILIWAIDREFGIIPDELNIFLAILGILLIAENAFYKNFSQFGSGSFLGSFSMLFGFRENIWINYLGAGLLGLVFIGLIVFLTRGKGMGIGDLKLAGALGLIFGWPDIIFVLIFSFIFGSVYGIYLLIKKAKSLKDSVSFGPFLVLGALTVIFFGQNILSVYFKFFNLM
jgi:leader peptidase (prepilin peptidase)/N-methyltransferase